MKELKEQLEAANERIKNPPTPTEEEVEKWAGDALALEVTRAESLKEENWKAIADHIFDKVKDLEELSFIRDQLCLPEKKHRKAQEELRKHSQPMRDNAVSFSRAPVLLESKPRSVLQISLGSCLAALFCLARGIDNLLTKERLGLEFLYNRGPVQHGKRYHSLTHRGKKAGDNPEDIKWEVVIADHPPAYFSAKGASINKAGVFEATLAKPPLLPDFLPLATGQTTRMMARHMRKYNPKELKGRVSLFGAKYEVEIIDPEGQAYFSPCLPGLEPELEGKSGGGILQEIARKMPDAYALKLLDLCISLALLDPEKNGKFWWHDSKATLAFNLSGRKDRVLGGVGSREKKRYAERFEMLASIRVKITKRHGKIRTEIDGPLISKNTGNNQIRTNKSGKRGRPTTEYRYEINEELFKESKRFNTRVPVQLFHIPAGPIYKLVRYVFVRCKMNPKQPNESLEQIAVYTGLSRQELEKGLKEVGRYPIPGLILSGDKNGYISMQYSEETPVALGMAER
jgi:hypothetical protein